MNRKEAEKLLKNAVKINPGKWYEHSLNVALVSERLAEELNLDKDFAYVCGLLHDIGRIKKGIGLKHVIDGFNYLNDLGYPDIARYALTHTFIIKDVHSSCAMWDISTEEGKIIQDYLDNIDYNLYDEIIQLADHLGDANGIVTIERRLVDVHLRKGFTKDTLATWKKIFSLQDKLENIMGHSIYSLFPEIKDNLDKYLVTDYLTFKD